LAMVAPRATNFLRGVSWSSVCKTNFMERWHQAGSNMANTTADCRRLEVYNIRTNYSHNILTNCWNIRRRRRAWYVHGSRGSRAASESLGRRRRRPICRRCQIRHFSTEFRAYFQILVSRLKCEIFFCELAVSIIRGGVDDPLNFFYQHLGVRQIILVPDRTVSRRRWTRGDPQHLVHEWPPHTVSVNS
jgi:hypothetical protein